MKAAFLSLTFTTQPIATSLAAFSVILMAGLLFTVEALIWGYAISEFNGTF